MTDPKAQDCLHENDLHGYCYSCGEDLFAKKDPKAQSKCCRAPMKEVGSPDFGDGSPEDVHTMYWVCEQCRQPCDSMGQEDINQDPINALKSAKEAIENLNKKPSLGDFVFKEYKGRFIPIGHIASIKVSLGNSPELIIETQLQSL